MSATTDAVRFGSVPFAEMPAEIRREFDALLAMPQFKTVLSERLVFNAATGCVELKRRHGWGRCIEDKRANYSTLKGHPTIKRVSAHVLVYRTCVGEQPAGHIIHHECERKHCVRPKHLRAMTQSAHTLEHVRRWKAAGITLGRPRLAARKVAS